MELKGRLKLVAEMVESCDTVCDIGTDHAYIPIYLVKQGKCQRAVAADVRKGPIEIAGENIRRYALEERIETRLGDGLDPIGEGEADTIIIAGMGGMLMVDILSRGINKARETTKLILQPMNAVEIVREWLYHNGFDILDESLADEGKKLYNIIAAGWTGVCAGKEEIYYHVGEKLVEENHPLLERHVKKKIRQLEEIIEAMKNSTNTEEEIRKKVQLKKQMEEILKKAGQP